MKEIPSCRFGRLLLAVPLLRMIRSSTVETFFFRDTVGDLSVNGLLQDLHNEDRVTVSTTVPAAAAVAVETIKV